MEKLQIVFLVMICTFIKEKKSMEHQTNVRKKGNKNFVFLAIYRCFGAK